MSRITTNPTTIHGKPYVKVTITAQGVDTWVALQPDQATGFAQLLLNAVKRERPPQPTRVDLGHSSAWSFDEERWEWILVPTGEGS